MWNWQQNDWPEFSYESKAMDDLEAQFLSLSGENLGAFKHVAEVDKNRLKVELISEEAMQTSKIEGEILDRDSLQSSIGRQFGLTSDHRQVPPAEQGVAAMMMDLYQGYKSPLDRQCLLQWHGMLMNGRQDIRSVGAYRTHAEPMRIVSGAMYEPSIHFEAPPSSRMEAEMAAFIDFFNQSAATGQQALRPLTRAGIAHLYFVSIHPFEDGNGRIARAIAEKSLAQSLGRPSLIALAYTIERKRKAYYEQLENSNKHNHITDWLVYFGETILQAQENTAKRIDFLIQKTKLYDRLRGQLNQRQQKVIGRMFREGVDGFKGGLSAENYISITGAARATVTRDLNDLVAKGGLSKTGQLKYTRYHLSL
ncbi:Fic family protein [Persicirhabdus sediminis]|uniref:Fic family protein n=2 Tax=Persicirhabdus sediminis TaxID=454144 RepID=A0A8J7MCN8_9BACT|nr:Fic family protein [Persicirhabdus sediminis]MBK1790877.1 Fic family protein [Persicirhabdus sediminis]